MAPSYGKNENVVFQEKWATFHYAVMLRAYLGKILRNKWIGRRGAIEWTARSLDFTPLDCFQ